jgi:sugar O-acyltransferase (sialic acid O-acetyltransferase NeuD family)
VADALLRIAMGGGPMRPSGFLDDTPALQATRYMDVPVLGTLEEIDRVPHDALIVAVGDNRARRQIYLRLAAQGRRFATVVHPTAAVPLDFEIGPGSYLGAKAVVGIATRVGANCIVNGAGVLGHHNRVGDHAHLGPAVHSTRDVRIGEGTMIGVGANIVSGISIGAWSVVGAGSLVTRDIPGGVVAYGAPARVVRGASGVSQ